MALVVLPGRAYTVRVPRAETLEGRVATLHSGLLPLRMAAVVVVVDRVRQRALAVLAEVSGQKELRPVLRECTARAEGVVVARQQA